MGFVFAASLLEDEGDQGMEERGFSSLYTCGLRGLANQLINSSLPSVRKIFASAAWLESTICSGAIVRMLVGLEPILCFT